MDVTVVVVLLLASHMLVLAVGFYAGAKFSDFLTKRRTERAQQVRETHRRNGRNGR